MSGHFIQHVSVHRETQRDWHTGTRAKSDECQFGSRLFHWPSRPLGRQWKMVQVPGPRHPRGQPGGSFGLLV